MYRGFEQNIRKILVRMSLHYLLSDAAERCGDWAAPIAARLSWVDMTEISAYAAVLHVYSPKQMVRINA